MFGELKTLIKTTPAIAHAYPIGCLNDIVTGEFVQAEKGNWIMFGGIHEVRGTAGPGNSHKTSISMMPLLTLLAQVPSSSGGVYDAENSLTYKRFNTYKKRYPGLNDFDFTMDQFSDEPRFLLWRRAEIEGDRWFEVIKEFAATKRKSAKNMRTLPMNNPDGKPAKILAPTNFVIDSLSAFSIADLQEKIVEKFAVGSSESTTVPMREAGAKSSLINQLPNLTARSGLHFGMTAHVGESIQMEKYAPQAAALTFAKRGSKMKNVSSKLSFICNSLEEVQGCSLLINPTDKAPLYPRTDADIGKGGDLFLVTSVLTRNKNGQSGPAIPYVISQKEGILKTLTEFHYIKMVGKKVGIGGSDRSFFMDLYPDCALQRTNIRTKIDEDPRLCIAIRLTSEMVQMAAYWSLDEELVCTPKELYDDIKALGYDWDVLLTTRYWWSFVEDESKQTLNELTIMDLLQMRVGNYHPYWLESDKVTTKKKYIRKG